MAASSPGLNRPTTLPFLSMTDSTGAALCQVPQQDAAAAGVLHGSVSVHRSGSP